MLVMGDVLSLLALARLCMLGWFTPEGRFAGAIRLGIALRVALVTYDILQNAVMMLAIIDRERRLRARSTTVWFSGAATLIGGATVGPMVAQAGLQSGPWFQVKLSLTFSCVALLARIAFSAQLSRGGAEQRDKPS